MLEHMLEFEERLPAGLRPTYRGATFIFGMGRGVAGRLFVLVILATLMLLAGANRGLALFFGLLGVALLAGAVAGTLHGILRPVERAGLLGTWLCWTITSFGYITAFGLLTPRGPVSLRDPTFYAFAAIISGLSAICLTLLDDRGPGRPTPRRFQSLQSRQRLWAAAAEVRARMQKRAILSSSRRMP